MAVVIDPMPTAEIVGAPASGHPPDILGLFAGPTLAERGGAPSPELPPPSSSAQTSSAPPTPAPSCAARSARRSITSSATHSASTRKAWTSSGWGEPNRGCGATGFGASRSCPWLPGSRAGPSAPGPWA
jgi:hypothetical protein